MTQPVLILHAGPHKTGSTALQIRLMAARAHLRQHGYDYPHWGLDQFAHHRIQAFLTGNPESAGEVTEASLQALAAAGGNLILSSENFIYLLPDQLAHLQAVFRHWRIEVVLFVRSPVALWPSHWQELVRHGRDETLLDYLGAHFGLNSVIDPLHLDPAVQASRFAHVFGRDAVRLFSYDTMMADRIDLFAFFIETVLRLPPLLPPQPTAMVNASFAPDVIEMLRCLNEAFLRRTGQTAGARIGAAYAMRRQRIDAHPRVAEFRAAFAAHAQPVRLDSDSPFLQGRMDGLARLWGDRLENPGPAGQAFGPKLRRTLPCGARYWAYGFGFERLMADLLDELSLIP